MLLVIRKTWILINNFHENTASSIVVNQVQSERFPVNQGVRRGGVLSSFLYLAFTDDLLNELEVCSKNTGVLNVQSSCPAFADDISCISLSLTGLQSLLNTAYMYSNK